MRTPLFLALLCTTLVACLPAYKNNAVTAPDSGAGDSGGSGGLILGQLFILDNGKTGDGAIGYLNNFPNNRSAPAGSGGSYMISVPQAACGTSDYVVFDGTITNGTLIKTIKAPKVSTTCMGTLSLGVGHAIIDDTSATGLRTTVAAELAAKGDISATDGASGAAFNAAYNWIFTLFIRVDQEGMFYTYVGGTVTTTGLDPACKQYYTNDYNAYKGGRVTKFVDPAATTASGGMLIFCPRAKTGEITLSGTGFFDPTRGAATFSPVTAPLMQDGVTLLEWSPTTF